MSWLFASCGAVATLQGIAWLANAGGRRRAAGVVLALGGIMLLCAGVVHGLVPTFFGQ